MSLSLFSLTYVSRAAYVIEAVTYLQKLGSFFAALQIIRFTLRQRKILSLNLIDYFRDICALIMDPCVCFSCRRTVPGEQKTKERR